MGFVNLLFLIGAASLAGPLLYHLLLRDRARRQVLPTLRFLGRAAPQTYAMHRIKNLILLLLRLAALALIVLAFMRPYMKSDAKEGDPETAPEGVVFAVDTSLSMRAGGRWANACARVDALIESQPPDSRMALLLFDRSPRLAVAATADRFEIQGALRAARPGAASTDLLAAVRAAGDAASRLKAVRKRVYVLSDLQKSGLGSVRFDLQMPPGVEVLAIPVDDTARFNATIQSVRETDSDSKDKRRIVVQTASYGTERHPATVRLRDGALELASRKIVIEGDRPVLAEMDLPMKTDREMLLTAELQLDDALEDDNAFPFRVEASRPLALLVVASCGAVRAAAKPGEIPPGANPFLKAALLASEPRVRTTWLDPSQAASAALSDYAVVLVVGAESLEPAAASRLKEYVQAGGALILFPDKETGPSFDELIGAKTEGWAQIDPDAGYRLVTAGANDGPFAIFDGSGRALLGDSLLGHPRATRYLRVSENPKDGAEAIARFDDGTAFLLARELGQGLVFCFAVPLDPRATDFVVRASFSPFLFELIRHAARRAEGAFDYRVGDVLSANEIPPDCVVIAPGERRLEKQTTLALSDPGFYRFVQGAKNRSIAARVAPEESDLAPMTKDEIERLNRLGQSGAVSKDTDLLNAAAVAAVDRAPDAQRRLWFYLLAWALGVMALETLLAAKTAR